MSKVSIYKPGAAVIFFFLLGFVFGQDNKKSALPDPELRSINFPLYLDDYSAAEIKSPIVEFNLPTPKSGPSIVNIGKESDVWVAMARAGKIGCFKNGQMTEYSLPAQSFPVGLIQDKTGFVWYSDIRRNVIGKLDPKTGELKDFQIPTKESWAFALGFDSKGNLWFTERVGNKIGRLDPQTGEVREYEVLTKASQPSGLTVTPDDQIFFTQNSGHKVGHFNPRTGEMKEYALPSPLKKNPFYGLAGIIADKTGNVWFSILDGKLGLIKKNKNGYEPIEEIALPRSNTRPAGITIDRWNEVWFTELDGNSISNYNHEFKVFRTYRIPTGEPDRRPLGPPETSARGEIPMDGLIAKTSRPFGIAADQNGDVWFSEQYAHKLGKLSPPKVELLYPTAEVSDFIIQPQIRLRLENNLKLKTSFFIDGKPVNAGRETQLDISNLTAGNHLLKVVVKDKAGNTFSDESAFHFNPGIASFQKLISDPVMTKSFDAVTLKKIRSLLDESQNRIANGAADESRDLLRQVILEIDALDIEKSNEKVKNLYRNLRYFDTFGQKHYRIEVDGKRKTFAPQNFKIEVGDSVSWHPAFPDTGKITLILETGGGDYRKAELTNETNFEHVFNSEGTFYFYDQQNPKFKGKISVGTRTTLIKEFTLPNPDRVPGVLAIDEKNNIWFTMGGGGFSRLANIPLNNRIGRFSPDGKFTEYETPTIESGPTSIHMSPDGNVWFTERGGNRIAVLDVETGKITEFELPTAFSAATGITVAPDGNVWYAAKLSSKVGVLNPVTREIKEYDTPSPKSQPSTITYDNKGNIWFDERANDRIVSLDPKTGKMREYQVPTIGSRVVGLVPDDEGFVWFLELGANKVGRLDVESGTVTEFSIPTKYSSPFKIARDTFGRIWFTQAFGNKIGVLLRDGRFEEFLIPTAETMPGGISIDRYGNVWFTQQAGNKLGVIPMGGIIPSDTGKQIPVSK